MSENSSLAPNEQKKNETRVSYTTENGNTFMAPQGLSPEKIEKLSVETDIMFFKKKLESLDYGEEWDYIEDWEYKERILSQRDEIKNKIDELTQKKETELEKLQESFKKTVTYKNSTQLFEDVKAGNMPFLGGTKKNLNGQDVKEIKPLAIKNAVTGKMLKGSNQLIAQRWAQELIKQGEKINGDILTFDEAKKEGIFLLKGKGNFQINEQGNTYRYFFDNSFSDKSAKYLAAAKYAAQTKGRIENIRRQLENDTSEAEKTALITRLAYEHRNYIRGNIIRPAAMESEEFVFDAYKLKVPIEIISTEKNEKGEEVKKTLEPQLPKLTKKIDDYLNNLPQDELKQFNDIVMKGKDKDGNEKNLSAEDLVKGFNNKLFQDNAEKYLQTINENARAKSKELTIDARNTHDPKIYLAKYLSACQLAKNNSKVTFLTDENSQKAVQDSLVKTMEKDIAEHRHVDVFRIGNEASLSVKDELKNFRSQQYANEHTVAAKELENEIHNEQSISF